MLEAIRRLSERPSAEHADGSFLLAIENALKVVRFGSRDDESLAFAANKIVRRKLDKHAITYSGYKHWRKHNRLLFTTVVDDLNQLIGFFDIFPLTAVAGSKILDGRFSEHSLTVDHIVSAELSSSAMYLHFATILLNSSQKRFNPMVAKEVLLIKLLEFLRKYYEPLEERTYLAFGQTRQGKALLERSGFAMTLLSHQNEQHCPLYVLQPSQTVGAIERFERAFNLFSSRPNLKMLDERLASIELQLRQLIISRLGSDPGQLPADVTNKILERIVQEAKRSAFDSERYMALPRRLEFCDLRELETIISNKLLWPKFESRFGTKEGLAIKFSQVAALRNALRHSRYVDEIAYKEGEAGIIWFERALAKTT